MLWNLQTYQDGVCADYAYNYGRRLAPTSSDIANYLDVCYKRIGVLLSTKELKGDKFVKPLTAGLSCLAALPNKASHLVPYPYKLLADDGNLVDEIYCSCIDDSGTINIEKFRSICVHEVRKRTRRRTTVNKSDDQRLNTEAHNLPKHSYQIKPLMKHWSVFSLQRYPLERPFDPPQRYCETVSNLRRNKYIQIGIMPASIKPKFNAAKNVTAILLDQPAWEFGKEISMQDLTAHMEVINFQDAQSSNTSTEVNTNGNLILSKAHSVVDLPILDLETDCDPSIVEVLPKVTPVAILHELLQVRKIQSIKWEESILDECLSLRIGAYIDQSTDQAKWSMTYRAQKTQCLSKRIVKHQLARAALNDFVGDDW